MSQLQQINVGNIANDGTGDDLREAFIKVNNNLLYLENSTQEPAIEGNNLGGAGEGIYASKDTNVLNFKEILAGSNVSLTSNSSSVIINSSGGISGIDFLLDVGHISVDNSKNSVPTAYILGGDKINTRPIGGDRILIDLENKGIVAHDTEPRLTASLQVDFNNLNNVGRINAQNIQGPLEGTVYGIDVRDINQYFENYWDFGNIISKTVSSIFEYITLTQNVDLGSFVGDEVVEFDIDLGEL